MTTENRREVRQFTKAWRNASPAARKAAKEHWENVYNNAIFPSTFELAEGMLLAIRDLEMEVVK